MELNRFWIRRADGSVAHSALENLTTAHVLNAIMPGWEEIFHARFDLQEARMAPLDLAKAQAMIALALGAIGKRINDDPDAYIWGLCTAIIEDELSSLLDGRRAVPFAPCELALGIRKLIRAEKFAPAPSELRDACADASDALLRLYRSLNEYEKVAETVDDLIDLPHDPKAFETLVEIARYELKEFDHPRFSHKPAVSRVRSKTPSPIV
jgi:hypothetical protein